MTFHDILRFFDLDLLLFIQSLRNILGSSFVTAFEYITQLGASTLAIVVLAVVYWSIHKETGEHIAFSFAAGSMFDQLLKNIFCVSRPWVRHSQIKPVQSSLKGATGYSFPSMHTQIGMNIYGTIGFNVKKVLFKVIFFAIPFAIGFSRMYLGVHTFQDVVAGLAVGFVSVFIADILHDYMDKKKFNDVKVCVIWLVLCIAFLLFVTLKSYPVNTANVNSKDMISDSYLIAGLAVGFIVCWPLERHLIGFEIGSNVFFRVIRAVIGLAGVFAVNKLVGLSEPVIHIWAYRFLKSFSVMVFIFFVYPLVFNFIHSKLFARFDKKEEEIKL